MRAWSRRNLVAVLAGLLVMIGLLGSANAITFDYSQQGGMTAGTETSIDFTPTVFGPALSGMRFFGPQPDNSPPLPAGPQFSTVGWGGTTGTPTAVVLVDPIGQGLTSALKVETLSGQVIDNGVPVGVALLTHQNSGILPNFLNTVTIDTLLRFADGATAVDIGPGAIGTVPIKLVETNNNVPAANCDPDIQVPPLPGVPCSDYFVFPLAGFFTPLTFNYLGVAYTINFTLTPLAGAIFEPVDCANDAGPPVDPTTFQGTLCGRIRTAEGSTNQILIQMSLTSEAPPANACPRTQGFWKNHPEAVTAALGGIDFLVVGGANYTQQQLINILKTPPKGGNAVLILAHQLIATKLNILAGSDSSSIQAAVLAADALLTGRPLPQSFVHSSTTLGQQMVALASQLDAFNNGANTPNCVGPQ